MVTPDPRHMNAAIMAGRTARGHTWPNPSVGCVLVDPVTNDIISFGYTQIGGRPHAEMDAITQAGERAKGAVAYVTLEPCNHTSPNKPVSCCDGLAAAGISVVIIAMPDPDPRMAGTSIKKLKSAGIDVSVGLGLPAAHHSHIGHCTRLAWGRPRVTLKLAHSKDGKIGIAGQRINISGQPSWDRTFLQRSKVDAIMVGLGTVLADDPQLTDRRPGVELQPVRIVVDAHARTPLTSKLIAGIKTAPVWILCAENADTTALEQAGVRIVPCPIIHDKIDMSAALKILGTIGLTHILCEGGATLATDLLNHQLVDEALIIEGPDNIGANGIPMPVVDLVLRNEDKVGNDIWRIYDSAAVLEFTRAFYANSQKFLTE